MTQTPKIEIITEHPFVAAGSEQTADVLIRIIPPEPEHGDTRPRLNLSLVLDRSGSMQGQKIIRAREAAHYCVDKLLPSDRFSIVIFDDRIDVLVPSRLARDRSDVRALLAGVTARGSTALHQAWVSGGIQVSERLDSAAINRVLLITDGLANVGETRTEEIVGQARHLAERGVTTSTIGIGRNFNEDLLIAMGTAGAGNSWHVAEPADMERIFATEMRGLIAQFGHTVRLGLVPGPGVKIEDVLNDFDKVEGGYRIPNLVAGSPLEIVVRLKLPAQKAGERLRALGLSLEWQPQSSSDGREEVVQDAFVEYAERDSSDTLVDHRVAKARELLMAARAQREAVALLDRGEISAAGDILAHSWESAVACARLDPDPTFLRKVDGLRKLADNLNSASPDLEMARKNISYQRHYLRTGKS